MAHNTARLRNCARALAKPLHVFRVLDVGNGVAVVAAAAAAFINRDTYLPDLRYLLLR